MASNKILIIFLVGLAAAVLPTVTPFQRYLVGDYDGWTTGVDYETWAKGIEFHVGDELVFLYYKDEHNVFKVNETRFQKCLVPPEAEAYTGGNNQIALDKPGKHWFMCGVDVHCLNGMKVEVTVGPDPSAPPATPPPSRSSAHVIATFWCPSLVTTLITFAKIISLI